MHDPSKGCNCLLCVHLQTAVIEYLAGLSTQAFLSLQEEAGRRGLKVRVDKGPPVVVG